MINLFLKDKNGASEVTIFQQMQSVEIILLFCYTIILYRLLVEIPRRILKCVNKVNIIASIQLTNGVRFDNKYILRPSADNTILVGDNPDFLSCKEKILLPKQQIQYISFKEEYIIFENEMTAKKVEEKGKIITIPN